MTAQLSHLDAEKYNPKIAFSAGIGDRTSISVDSIRISQKQMLQLNDN